MNKQIVRTSLVLTTSYVAGQDAAHPNIVKNPAGQNQLVLLVNFTKGSLTTAELKVELSYDEATYAREVNAAVSGGSSTLSANEYVLSADGIYQILVPLAGAVAAKVSIKGTGTVTSSLAAIDAYVVNV